MNDSIRFLVYLAVMAGITYLIRVIPMLLFRGKVKNRLLRSFLYYVPYTVLAAMAFPTVITFTDHLLTGILATAVCIVLSLCRRGLIVVAIGGAVTVLLCEMLAVYIPLI